MIGPRERKTALIEWGWSYLLDTFGCTWRQRNGVNQKSRATVSICERNTFEQVVLHTWSKPGVDDKAKPSRNNAQGGGRQRRKEKKDRKGSREERQEGMMENRRKKKENVEKDGGE